MAQATTRYQDRISQDPAVMVGKPVVRGTRIPVELVLDWLSGNFDLEVFFAAYPDLSIEDVQACLAFGRDSVNADYRRWRQREARATAAKA